MSNIDKDSKTVGLLPFVFDISQDDVDAMIAEYRKAMPDDTRSDEQLRPFAVNEIISRREPTHEATYDGDTVRVKNIVDLENDYNIKITINEME